jgi:Spy/CpxP family protein refolding chaperone
MRMRTIGAAVVAAAALTVTLTGAAGASTPAGAPAGDGVIIICKNGKLEKREMTEEDRKRIEELRKRAAESPDGKVRIEGEGEGKRKVIIGDGRDGRSPEEICESRRS